MLQAEISNAIRVSMGECENLEAPSWDLSSFSEVIRGIATSRQQQQNVRNMFRVLDPQCCGRIKWQDWMSAVDEFCAVDSRQASDAFHLLSRSSGTLTRSQFVDIMLQDPG